MEGKERPLELTGEDFAVIFNVLPNPMYIWEKVENDLVLIKFNIAAKKFTESKIEKFIKITASELHKDDPEILNDLNRCINEKISISKEMKYKLKSLDKEVILHVDYFFIPPNKILVHTENKTEQKRLQDILSKSEAEKTIILNTAKELISFQDKDLKIIWANKAAAESVNITLEDLIGRHCYEIWPKRTTPCENCPVLGSIKTGSPQKGEQKTPDDRYWSISGDPVRDASGNIIGAVEITTEITELKQKEKELKESEEIFRTIAEQSFMGISIIQDDIIKYTNQAMLDIFGYSIDEIIKWQPLEYLNLFPPEEREFMLKHERKKENEYDTKVHNYQIRFIKKSGEFGWLDLYSNAIQYKGRPAGLISIIDITDKKKFEEKLKESEEKYREAYYRMNLYKDLFTHDINNIFQNILSSNELAMLYSNNPEKLQDYVEVANLIKDQVLRGSKLVSSVKKLADLEEGEKSLYKINILNPLTQAIVLIKKHYIQKQIEIEIQSVRPEYFINGNELLIDLFENILHKSLHDNKNQRIEIFINISEEIINTHKLLKIEFTDNGVGFPNTLKDMILKNKELDDKKINGIGIELLLIKRIIENYNGFFKIEDQVPGDWTKGSNFIIYLPEVG